MSRRRLSLVNVYMSIFGVRHPLDFHSLAPTSYRLSPITYRLILGRRGHDADQAGQVEVAVAAGEANAAGDDVQARVEHRAVAVPPAAIAPLHDDPRGRPVGVGRLAVAEQR